MLLKNLVILSLLILSQLSFARSHISIVGSSTVYPFSTVIAERFGQKSHYPTPTVESTGTGSGISLFCSGLGVGTPDITNASRRIKITELDRCIENGVLDVMEIKIGYDGIVLANALSAAEFDFDDNDLFFALAMFVPVEGRTGELQPNPYRRWSEINPALPDLDIEVLGPPPSSGTRDAFLELAMEQGCRSIDWIESLKEEDPLRYKAICHALREDGAYIEAGENDNLIVQKLAANPSGLGIFGYSFLTENATLIKGALINGVSPSVEAIVAGEYPISRSLYIYAKGQHIDIVPGMRAFLDEYIAAAEQYERSYLAERGLVPINANELDLVKKTVTNNLYITKQHLRGLE